MAILATGMIFGMAGFRPVPAIVLAQALNGLILPVIAVFLFLVVNNPKIMKGRHNRLTSNAVMAVVVCISIGIGLAGLLRALEAGLGPAMWDWKTILAGISGLAVCITGFVIYRISLLQK